MATDVVHSAADLKPLITSDQRDQHGEERRLPDADQEVPHGHGFLKAGHEFRKADIQLARRNEHPAEHTHGIRVHRQERKGDYQGLWGFSGAGVLPDTAIPINLRVPIYLDIPITGTLGTVTVESFTVPAVIIDATFFGDLPARLIDVRPITISSISIDLPAIGLRIGTGPGPLIDMVGTGGLLPLSLPPIDIAVGPGFGNSTSTPSSGFFNSGAGGNSGFGNFGAGLSGWFNSNMTGLFGGSGTQNSGGQFSGFANLGNAVSGLANIALSPTALTSGLSLSAINLGVGNVGTGNVGLGNWGVNNLGAAYEAAGQIGEKLGLPPATLSFHLAGLTRAGLARSRTEGRFVIYSADYAAMNALVGFLSENCCGGRECQPSTGETHETPARTRRRA